jgi:uncharacterized RDD family membrane protein YckC
MSVEAKWWQRLCQLIADTLIIRFLWYVAFYFIHPTETNAYYGISLLISLTYFALMEGFFSRTIGMSILNIRVVKQGTNENIDFATAIIRTLGRLVCSLTLGIGYLFFLHDKIAGTKVVTN